MGVSFEVYGGDDFRNHCEWFVSVLVANGSFRMGSYRRFRWFVLNGFYRRQLSLMDVPWFLLGSGVGLVLLASVLFGSQTG